ncbi:pilus assembly protein PilO [Azotobacter chroococcum subsp. isscasi]|uniref:GspMb/PilO family protein n=1 Tax=Azotobacter chroococcum TaxID=353 RepID=UPI00103B3E20|nr:GspMb/PilO family protein [Azotobacter chroococcum]TBW07578.1 pilus assembly protein PilO [Azotobacter chroococcum subsp. isscasi]
MAVHRLILRERLRRLGWPGAGGAALLALAAAHGLFVLWPAWQAREALAAQIVAARERQARIERGIELPAQGPGQQLADFHRQLPAQPAASSAIDRIYAAARAHNLSLARGEYSLGIDPKTRLARYRILLPVRAGYPQLRRFLHSLLSEVPALVLEDVEFKRKAIHETELEARIRMTLYLSRW